MTLRTIGDTGAPASVAALLRDPSVSFALKRVLRTWQGRDVLDAAADARLLADVLEHRAREAVSWIR